MNGQRPPGRDIASGVLSWLWENRLTLGQIAIAVLVLLKRRLMSHRGKTPSRKRYGGRFRKSRTSVTR